MKKTTKKTEQKKKREGRFDPHINLIIEQGRTNSGRMLIIDCDVGKSSGCWQTHHLQQSHGGGIGPKDLSFL